MNVAHVLAVLRAQAEAADPVVVYAAAIALGVLTWTLLRALVRATSTSKHPSVYRPKSTLPILGNTLDAYFQQHRFFDWLVDESTASGTKPWVMSILGRPPTYVLCTPEAFEDVFKTHVSVFEKGPAASFTFKDFLGEGIIAVDGHKWFTQRKTASHLFSMQMMRDVMEHVVSEKALIVHSILKDCVARKQQVAMSELFSKLSSDVFGRVGFGVDLNCLANPFTTTPDHAFIEAIKSGAHTLQLRFQQPMWLWRLQRFLNIGPERQTKKDIKVLNDLVRTIIFKSMQNKNDAIAAAQRAEAVAGDSEAAKAAERSKGKDLLSLFLDTGDHTDVNFMRDMVINFFAAGKDTTTLNMSWFILMMNRYPHVAAKVRAELETQLPDVVSGAKPVPTSEDLSKLVYLEAALRESMRLNNSMTSRSANADVTLSDGTFIPKDANLIISIYVCSRMKSVWGEDAAEYKPERWIDPATGKLIRFSPYKDITFLVGPRQCIGMRFALLQMKTVLAMIMSQFDVKTVEDPFQVTYEFSFIMAIGSKLVSDISDAPRSSTMAAAAH